VAHSLGTAEEIENMRYFGLCRLNQRLHRKLGGARLERERNNAHALAAKDVHETTSRDWIFVGLKFE